MSKQSAPKTLGLVAIVVLVLGGGATYFQFQNVQKAKAEVAALESELPSQKELEESLATSKQQLTEYQKKLIHLEGNVPDVAYIPTLMKELERIGKGHGIAVTGVRPAPQSFMQAAGPAEEGKKEKKKSYEEIEIEVKGRGDYDDVKAFLDSIQTFPKVLAVSTVSMTPMRESGGRASSEIEIVVNVIAYVFPFEMVKGDAKLQAKAAPSNAQSAPGAVLTDSGEQTADSKPSSTVTVATETQVTAKAGGRN